MKCNDARINNFYFAYGEVEITEEIYMTPFAEFLYELSTHLEGNELSKPARSENE